MPRHTRLRSSAIARVLKIYFKLQEQPYISYKMLKISLDLDYHKARRDIRTLEEAGVPIYEDYIPEHGKVFRLLKKSDGTR